MILKRISILNYKNLEQAELEFSPKMNCFIGQNGMGKTNLLDAVYYLSSGIKRNITVYRIILALFPL